jgi:hypothetical protein
MSLPITRDASSPVPLAQRSTAHASLAALGAYVRHLNLFGPIREHVHIAQKAALYPRRQALRRLHRAARWRAGVGGDQRAAAC